MSAPVVEGLERVWEAVSALPDDPSLGRLDPATRRAAHDLGVRIQDRLLHTLSTLVAGMAADGADLVDGRGVPRALSGSVSGDAAAPEG